MAIVDQTSSEQPNLLVARFANLSLRNKFLILLVVVVVGFDIAFVSLWQPRATQFVVDLQSSEVRSELTTAGEGMVPFLIQNQFAAIHETLDVIKSRHENWVVLVLKDANGKRIYPLSPPPDLGSRNLVRLEEKVYFRGEVTAVICAMVDFSEEQEQLARQGYFLIALVTAIFAMAMLVIAVFFEVLIGRRAAKLSTAVESLAEGNFDAELPAESGDEIGRLVQRVSEMRENVFLNQKSLSKAREEAETATQAKSQFLAVMSHEIRTPLNGMLGTLQLLESTKLSKEQSKYLSVMGTSGELLLHHVNDVLDLSRLDAEKVQIFNREFNVNSLVSDVMDSMQSVAQKNRNSLRQKKPAFPEMVWGDSVRIRQVLLNLISNAIKYTQNGDIEVAVSQLPGDDKVTIAISDTGIGIARENLDRVFKDFETIDASHMRRTGGTGLGLSISKRFVDAMGGEISVESKIGKGSVFQFSWVLQETDEVTETELDHVGHKAVQEPSSADRSLDILVVEDNYINQFVVREMLEKAGHKVSEADDGKEGVLKAVQHCYDLILMDISMPEFDGIEATRAIRAAAGASSKSPIVALTAHAMPDDVAQFKRAGMNDTLIKPVSLPLLLKTIQTVVEVDARTDCAKNSSRSSVGSYLDLEQLAELAANVGKKKVSTLAKAFVADADLGIEALVRDTVAVERMKSISEIAHKLAGSAAMFGALQLQSSLVEIVSSARSGNSAELKESLPLLNKIWSETKSELDDYFANRALET